jgi:hypothetical protein
MFRGRDVTREQSVTAVRKAALSTLRSAPETIPPALANHATAPARAVLSAPGRRFVPRGRDVNTSYLGASKPGTALRSPETTTPGTEMICGMIRPEGMSRPVGAAMQAKPGTDMACGMIRPEGLSRPVGTAMQAKPGTDMACGMIRPEGMSRPVGTAMQAKPGTDMACGMIRPEGMSRPVGTAMQAKPGTDMACGMIRPEGTSRPVGTATEYAFVQRGRDAPALQRRPQVSLRAPIPGFANMPEMGQLANEFYSQSAVLTPEEHLKALRAAQRLVDFCPHKGWLVRRLDFCRGH